MAKPYDLSGQRFGRLVAIRRVANGGAGKDRVRWECVCDCGNTHMVRAAHLKSGLIRSCGCLRREINSERFSLKLLGQRFGRLVVVERYGRKRGSNVYWRCLCDCGNEAIVRGTHLVRGSIVSCGCYHVDAVSIPDKGRAALNRLYSRYKNSANFKGTATYQGYNPEKRSPVEFSLTIEQFEHITKQRCAYCGIPPSAVEKVTGKHKYGQYVYNGLDRIDPNKGYTTDNVLPCCKMCNRAKWRHSQEEFIAWLKRIAYHWRQAND